MKVDWKKIGTDWVKPAAMAVVIPACVSYFISNRVDQNSKVREAQSAQIAKFASGNDSVFLNAANLIANMSPTNFTPSHDALRKDYVQQIQLTDNLLLYFRGQKAEGDVKSYRALLDKSLAALEDANDPIKLVKWANSLSQLSDAKIDLLKELLATSQIAS